ncbi:hypothetical protein ACFPAF_15255 [Hymenobacter endophyticus]|uniref:Outer membrane protein beta-barrel domain-containing protein n=1 Tax=Hymenobacter endophyticus TaxID=3076335 RepID=A0ABU3TK57_9BACT|nr:hypothetical protein [Hymenobacter endophyticus]MDU0371759.1 hypothetical protein [Hymenobacter endophyticus]
MLKLSTLLLAGGLAYFTVGQAHAQTELNSRPQPGMTPSQATPAPAYPQLPLRPTDDDYPRYQGSLALELGWGAPYGFGVSYAHHLTPNWDINGGLGIGIGGKIGIGTRYFLKPERTFTPYVGANVVRTGRIDQVSVELNGEQAVYSMASSATLHLRGGVRWQPGRVGLLATGGYGVRLGGNPVVYDPAYNPSPQLRNFVDIISPGGVEVSVGIVVGLGR